MKLSVLKKIRVFVSLIFFILTFLLFIDIHNWFSKLSEPILYLQFVPSIVKFVSLLSVSALGFIFIIILNLLFGRVYCSTICPLGTMQDIFSFISRRLKQKKLRKKFHRYTNSKNVLRYTFFALTLLTFLLGFGFILDLLDPYSNFGRLSTSFARPVLIYFNNILSNLLGTINNYSVLPIVFREVNIWQFIFPVTLLLTVFWLSYNYGRLYCNTICPVGTFLGLISKLSLYRIAINPISCNHCSQCVYVCKSGCIDKDNQTLDFSRCVSCYNCFNACSSNALYFQNNITGNIPIPVDKIRKVDLNKRNFISSALGLITTISGGKSLVDSLRINRNVVVTKASRIPENKIWLVLPPGSLDIKHFNNYCTACSLCVSSCPTNVLQPSFLEFGVEGMMQPFMNYSSSFCNFECKICSEVCPTGAIIRLETLDQKKAIQMGKAQFIKENCVVYTEHTDCGACSEHCPTKAVNMVPFDNTGLFIPKIDDTICVGCGACEYPCPVRPYKAIFVNGNPVQLVADKPNIEKLEKSKLGEDEFPF